MFHPTVVKFFSFRMPAKRTQARKRTRRTAEEGPLAQRSRRETTRNATLASRGSTSVPAEDESNVIPLANTPPAVQRLDPSLVQSLVSTVTAEVTRQLTATLPALASLEGLLHLQQRVMGLSWQRNVVHPCRRCLVFQQQTWWREQ